MTKPYGWRRRANAVPEDRKPGRDAMIPTTVRNLDLIVKAIIAGDPERIQRARNALVARLDVQIAEAIEAKRNPGKPPPQYRDAMRN
jgi:hypothetical protein